MLRFLHRIFYFCMKPQNNYVHSCRVNLDKEKKTAFKAKSLKNRTTENNSKQRNS